MLICNHFTTIIAGLATLAAAAPASNTTVATSNFTVDPADIIASLQAQAPYANRTTVDTRFDVLNSIQAVIQAQKEAARSGVPINQRGQPAATFRSGSSTVYGRQLGRTETFAGIPFAKPPMGNLRLRKPVALDEYDEVIDAGGIAAACPQMFFSLESNTTAIFDALGTVLTLPLLDVLNGQEDCLTLTIHRPKGTTANEKLPVLFWIFGGGFQLGGTSMYEGAPMIETAIDNNTPAIIVMPNYRVGGFGFLPGKEVKAGGAANLGMLDQRLAMEWVADNIADFGGDPEKVTIWGESAGAISVFNQLTMYGGDINYNDKPLFRGAIMNSGSMIPLENIDSSKAQKVYDKVVSKAGCSGASDTLQCLREADYTTLLQATNSLPGILSYEGLNLPYLPRPDGEILTDSSVTLARDGKYVSVPMIIGDQEDEGTLFSLLTSNLKTNQDIANYLTTYMFQNINVSDMVSLINTYGTQPWDGSPFGTFLLNQLYSGFKRVAAVLGDLVFNLCRRLLLEYHKANYPDSPTWSYLAGYYYGIPYLGTCHGSDLLAIWYGLAGANAANTIRTYYFNFATNLDPNVGASIAQWPGYYENLEMMHFRAVFNGITRDDYRSSSMDWVRENVDRCVV